MTTGLTAAEIEAFESNGFHFPLDVMSEEEAEEHRLSCRRYVDVANEAGGALSIHRYYPKIHLLNRWADALVRNERVLDAVESLIGPDILVWATQIFNRKAGTGISLGWHQDAVYYGFNGFETNAVRVWVALTPTTRANGTMSYSRGSHNIGIHEHGFRSDDIEEKMRGEEVLVDIDPGSEVEVLLRAGQASIHNMIIAHSSGINVSDADRINFAIDFLSPKVEPIGLPDSALLVRGEDRYGNFELEQPPENDFGESELAAFFHATALRNKRINKLLQDHRDEAASPGR